MTSRNNDKEDCYASFLIVHNVINVHTYLQFTIFFYVNLINRYIWLLMMI